jgi:hypothetical protein
MADLKGFIDDVFLVISFVHQKRTSRISLIF